MAEKVHDDVVVRARLRREALATTPELSDAPPPASLVFFGLLTLLVLVVRAAAPAYAVCC